MNLYHKSRFIHKVISLLLLYFVFNLYTNNIQSQNLKGIDVEDSKEFQNTSIEIIASLDREDWIYEVGEVAVFKIKVTKDSKPYIGAKVFYKIGLEKMKPTTYGEQLTNEQGELIIRDSGLKSPGFLRCEVNVIDHGRIFEARATAAYSPQHILPTVAFPADFNNFWNSAVQRARSVPLNENITFLEDKSTEEVNVYQVSFDYLGTELNQFYGTLCVPMAEGVYPAIIRFPGAGWAPLAGDKQNASKGFITLDLYIHGHPINKDKAFYEGLKKNELKDYMFKGLSHRDSFYYHNVILGCVRGVDFIYSLPIFDGENLGAWGSSQGGALSIITTSLDQRIDYVVALCPAMCDYTGYLFDRAGGWPHHFIRTNFNDIKDSDLASVLAYYDVVNFSKNITVPGYYSWGFNDLTTPPTSFYSAYNMIQSAKQTLIIPSGEHKIYPIQREATYQWLRSHLTTNRKED